MKNLLERKYYMPFNLQLFAEGSEDDLKDESNGNDEEKKEEKKYSDSDLEQIINRTSESDILSTDVANVSNKQDIALHTMSYPRGA